MYDFGKVDDLADFLSIRFTKKLCQNLFIGKGMNDHTRRQHDLNQKDAMIRLLYVIILFLSQDHITQCVGLVPVSSLLISRTAFQQKISPIYPMVPNINKDHLRYKLSCSLKQSVKPSQRGCDSVLALRLFRRVYQMGMVAKDDISIIDESYDTKAMQRRDDDLDNNPVANHFFDIALINHKLQGLNLSDQKLLVLQDAAKRMVQRHETQMKEIQQHHSSRISTSIEKRNTQHQIEIEMISGTMDQRLRQMEFDRNKVIDELKRTKREYTTLLETERKANSVKLEEVYAKYKEDHSSWVEAERQLRDALELVKMDAKFSIGNATATIQRLDLDVRQQKEKYQSLNENYEAHQTRYLRTTAEMEQLRIDKYNLETELEFERENVIKLQQQFNERMEIAESSVAAATSRENILQVKYDSLRQINNNLREEVSRLKQELQQQNEAYQELNIEFLAETTNRKSPILSNALQRARKYIWYNDQSLLRVSCRWIQTIFVPKIFPFRVFPMQRTTTKQSSTRT